MRKIIFVRRNKNDTMMFFVAHDPSRQVFEIWRTGWGDLGTMEMERMTTLMYTDQSRARVQIMARTECVQLAGSDNGSMARTA